MTIRIPGRRRRRRPAAVMAALVIAGLIATVIAGAGLAAWWLRRRDELAHVDGHTLEEAAFDATALDRAAGEGMASTLAPAPDAVEAAAAASGASHEPVETGRLVRLV